MNKLENQWFFKLVEAEATLKNAENLKILKSKKT